MDRGETTDTQREEYTRPVWPDCAIYCTLGNFSKPVASIILPIIAHIFRQFLLSCQTLSFFWWNHLGNFYSNLATFNWSHCSRRGRPLGRRIHARSSLVGERMNKTVKQIWNVFLIGETIFFYFFFVFVFSIKTCVVIGIRTVVIVPT